MGPPYPVDEASFTDTCKRLSSVEGSLLGAPGGGDGTPGSRRPSSGHGEENKRGGRPDSVGDSVLDKTVRTDLLMRSLGCLASFRCGLCTCVLLGAAENTRGLGWLPFRAEFYSTAVCERRFPPYFVVRQQRVSFLHPRQESSRRRAILSSHRTEYALFVSPPGCTRLILTSRLTPGGTGTEVNGNRPGLAIYN